MDADRLEAILLLSSRWPASLRVGSVSALRRSIPTVQVDTAGVLPLYGLRVEQDAALAADAWAVDDASGREITSGRFPEGCCR